MEELTIRFLDIEPHIKMNPSFNDKKKKYRNKSELSAADCYLRFGDPSRDFEDMSDDDLDSIYAVVFNRWAYHLTRQGYIDALKAARENLLNKNIES
jgi:hypothetical protein